MSSVAVKVDKISWDEFNRRLQAISQYTTKSTPNLLKQAAIWFTQSVIKETPPSKSSTIRGIPEKYKIRPVVRMPGRNWYVWAGKNGQRKLFKSENKIHLSKHPEIMSVQSAVKFWDKKNKDWGFLPFLGFKEEKSAKNRKIPHYGAAKAGWLYILRSMGKGGDPEVSQCRHIPGQLDQGGDGAKMWYKLTNLVGYAAKIAPDSVGIAMRKTVNRLEAVEYKKHQTDVKNIFNGAKAS